MTKKDWLLNHAETHGQINATLRAMDANMDELQEICKENTRCHWVCREEILKKIVTLTTIAREEAKAEAKSWLLKVAIVAALLAFAGGFAVMLISVIATG